MSATEPQSFHDGRVVLHPGDCLASLRKIPSNSVDAVVTDPPYALVSIARRYGKDGAALAKVGATGAYARASAGFMGKSWDTGERAFAVEFWEEVFRVLKPGGHVLAFSATRTVHRLTCAIEDAGFEIRDGIWEVIASDTFVAGFLGSLDDAQRAAFVRCIEESQFGGALAWIYGTGFPKSHDVAKGIDAKLGVAREVVGSETLSNDIRGGALLDVAHGEERAALVRDVTVATSEAAKAWEGWGTALKPALEPITMARKPLIGTVAETVLAYGTGALNIDACRIEMSDEDRATIEAATFVGAPASVARGSFGDDGTDRRMGTHDLGRWPANVVVDGSDEVVAAFPQSAGQQGDVRGSEASVPLGGDVYGHGLSRIPAVKRGDEGSAARFFYSSKADGDDRIGSKHPTVKPVDLMRWCVRLVCPPGGVVLDPFGGTGTTGEAAFREGMRAILCEREPEYQADIARRMALLLAGPARRRAESAKARARTPKPCPMFGEA